MANTIASGFVEVALAGMTQVENDLGKLRGGLAGVPGKIAPQVVLEGVESAEMSLARLVESVDLLVDIILEEQGIKRLEQIKKAPKSKTYIQVVLEGLQKAKKELDNLKKKVGEAKQGLSDMGNKAAVGFGVGVGAIGKFVQMADPVGFERFQVAIAKVGIQVGRFFVPLLREATVWVDKISDYLKGLSDDVRENVLHWAKVTLAVLGTVAVFAKVGSALMGMLSPFNIIAGLLMLVFQRASAGGGSMGSLQSVFERIQTAIAPLIAALMTLVEAIAPIIEQMMPAFISAFESIIGIITWIVELFAGFNETVLTIILTFGMALVVLPKLVGAFQLVIGGIRMMQMAMMAFMANPWVAGIMLIVAAIAALVISLSSTGNAVDEIASKLSQMEALTERLQQGGRIRRRELGDALANANTAGGTANYAALINAPNQAARVAMARQQRQQLEQQRQQQFGNKTQADMDIQRNNVRDALRDREGENNFNRLERRRERLVAAGLNEQQITQMTNSGMLNQGSMTEQQMNTMLNLSQANWTNLNAGIASLQAVEAGNMEGDQSNKFKGEVKTPAAAIGGILDQWKKLQTAQEETAEQKIAREQLAQSQSQTQTQQAIATSVATIATQGAPAVPGG